MEQISFDNRWLFEKILELINRADSKIKRILNPYFKNFAALSKFFNKYEEFIYDYRKESRRFRIFSIKILNDFRKAIKENFKKWKNKYPILISNLNYVESKLLFLINKYEKIHQPKETPNSQIKTYHPNIKIDYFKKINTKEKAYWLGFLYADGYISKRKKNNKFDYRVGIALKARDKYIIEKFCRDIGGNLKYVKIEKIKSISGKYIKLVRFRFYNKRFAQHLICQGLYSGKDKAKKIKLPTLGNLNSSKKQKFKLYLAFLLGYYDGDGTLGNNGQSRIFSSNRKFLLEIKEYFNFKTKIIHEENEIYDPNRRKTFNSSIYVLTIPKSMFKIMMINYRKSLVRKRITLNEFVYKKRENKVQNWIKKVIDKKRMNELVNNIPLTRIANLLGVDFTTLKKVLIDYDIKIKPPNFWSSKVLKIGHRIEIPKHLGKLLKNISNQK